MRIDLHVHSNVSDGTESPTRLVFAAQEAGLDVIGLCDHDTFDGVAEAREAGRRIGLAVLPGVEMSTRYKERPVHLLGYGCDPWNRPLLLELTKLRVSRVNRLQGFLDKLSELGMPLTAEDVQESKGLSPSLGRPHIADALVAKGYVANRDEAFAKYLGDGKPAYVERYATPIQEAIRLIRGAKGLAVIAHPWGPGAKDVLTGDALAELARAGLEGIEVDHTDHDPRSREMLTQLGARTGLIRTGSSDYHGIGKSHNPLGINTTRPTAYQEIVNRIAARGGVGPN